MRIANDDAVSFALTLIYSDAVGMTRAHGLSSLFGDFSVAAYISTPVGTTTQSTFLKISDCFGRYKNVDGTILDVINN